jgi:hypothetical protein
MTKYTVTVEVDYIVEAISLSEAYDIVSSHTEHPLIGQGEGSYCDDDRIIGGAVVK